MSMIPDEVIEQVRDSADLLSIIGESVDLRRTGSDYRGPCPFHGGQHRNFAVIPRKGRYYCFVCKESGDVFSWYMKRHGMDYPSAVREVARKSGIVIPETAERAGPDPREPLFQAMAVAQDWFARQLREVPEAEEGRQYLRKRGFDLEVLEPFELGFAPRSPGFLPAMAALGLEEAVMLEAGLLARREDGRIVPRFRGRLLFPIHDLRGRVVGFGGRLLGPGEPKYLNSPESPVFRKGATLYNLHAAKNAIRKEGCAILVEGYFDVLRLVVAGKEEVVAPLGTALTADQAGLLRRLAPAAVLLLDSDMAGLKATFRAGDELLRHETRVRVATLPPGEDPDTLVQNGGLKALEPILRDAVDVMERKIQLLDRKGWFTGIEHRRDALDRLLPTIRATKDPIQRELYLSLVAERSGVDKKVLEHEADSAPAIPPPARAAPLSRPGPAASADPRREGARAELALLRLMASDSAWRSRVLDAAKPEWFETPVHRELFDALRSHPDGETGTVPEGLSPLAAARWARLVAAPADRDTKVQDQVFDGACRVLEARPHFRRLDQLSARLTEASPEDQAALFRERRALLDELRGRFPDDFTQRYGWRRLRRRAGRGRPNR
ncbi:MAG TPA: DNA primase [Gemmatimonadales bacterium]|nr:DNA primase [Gemmatimonadales bacterium]